MKYHFLTINDLTKLIFTLLYALKFSSLNEQGGKNGKYKTKAFFKKT